MQVITSEILINSRQVTRYNYSDSYEFILNEHLKVVDCVKLANIGRSSISPIIDPEISLYGMLFELNHVRVNPRIDNTFIIHCLTVALTEIGVKVNSSPKKTAMSICYKPMGEISDCVRFYLNVDKKLIFLSPATKPRLIHTNPNLKNNAT